MESFEHVEQFYFAGGEPIIMEEHYRILKELDKRKMYHVRLIYNTNFSRTTFKDIDVLNYGTSLIRFRLEQAWMQKAPGRNNA